MNGIHDLGGMHGLGPVLAEANEPVFHEPWEGRAFALFASTFVFAGYTVDEFRHAIEKIPPAHYLEIFLLRTLDVHVRGSAAQARHRHARGT